jgi:hypothetical protein
VPSQRSAAGKLREITGKVKPAAFLPRGPVCGTRGEGAEGLPLDFRTRPEGIVVRLPLGFADQLLQLLVREQPAKP